MKRFLALVALVEAVVAIVLVLLVRDGSCVAFNASPSFGRVVRATPSADPTGSGAPVVPPPAGSPVPAPSETSAAASGLPHSASADTGSAQVPDPNCVAKTTAGLLNANSSTTPPSCAPITVPSQ